MNNQNKSGIMEILLGFETPSGKVINIPIRHMCVTGQTQMAGKTTTLEALISRSGLRAIAFITKRGEGSFNIGRAILPFFKDSGDWQYVESVIESTLKEKNKFQRYWVQQVCKGAKSLAHVHKNTKKLMKSAKERDRREYELLDSYLDIVVPQIAQLPKSSTLEIGSGLNVMDLTAFSPEMQMLVVRSAIEWVHKHETGVITIIPEAWKFVPEGRGSPVKPAAIALVREGAGLKNFIWVDAQDIRGVDKVILGGCTVWTMGVQRERNEIERVLDQIPGSSGKISAEDVARLKIGQFYACFDDNIHKTYVQPAWMTKEDAQKVAMGKLDAKAAKRIPVVSGTLMEPLKPLMPLPSKGPALAALPWEDQAPTGNGELVPQLSQDDEMALTEEIRGLREDLRQFMQGMVGGAAAAPRPIATKAESPASAAPAQLPGGFEATYQQIKARLMGEAPQLIKVLTVQNEIEVTVEKQVISTDPGKVIGRVAMLIAKKWFDNEKGFTESQKELQRIGGGVNPRSYSDALTDLVKMGFLTKEETGKYKAVPGMKVNIKGV